MRKFFRKVAVGLLIFSVTTAGVAISSPKAEAFSLGDITGGLGKILGVGKGVDINTANERMLENFYYSVALLKAAYDNVKIATDSSIANKEAIMTDSVARSAVKNNTPAVNMKDGAAQSKKEAEDMKKYLDSVIAEGDEEKLKQIDAIIKVANEQRLVSNVMAHIAYTQIGIITATQVTNVASGNLEGIGNIIAIAKETEALLKIRNELSAQLKTATESYRKTRGIKDPSKKEQKEAAKKIEALKG